MERERGERGTGMERERGERGTGTERERGERGRGGGREGGRERDNIQVRCRYMYIHVARK